MRWGVYKHHSDLHIDDLLEPNEERERRIYHMPNTNLREKLIELVMDHCITDETESGLYRRSDINRYTDMYLLELLEDNLGLEFQPESFDDSSDFKVWDGLGDDDSMVSPAGWFGPYPDNPAEKGCKCDPATCKCNPCNCKG